MVQEYSTKITRHNLGKNPVVPGTLLAIKDQYVMLDTRVVQLHKFTGYRVIFG